MNAGFYRFDVHFFDGAEQNAHGFVYADNYANAIEKVCDMVADEDIADIKIEGMEPGEVLLMPDWIADKIVKYDYFGSGDYKQQLDKTIKTDNANSLPTAKELSQTKDNPFTRSTQEYINDCINKGIPIKMPRPDEDWGDET